MPRANTASTALWPSVSKCTMKKPSVMAYLCLPMCGDRVVKSELHTYYSKRAGEYERIYEKPERQSDLAKLKDVVRSFFASHVVLEVACGTGYWTQIIA